MDNFLGGIFAGIGITILIILLCLLMCCCCGGGWYAIFN